jgi:NADPH-dependent F420 reductase
MQQSQLEPVTIVGASGSLGFGLAVRLGSVGHPVVLGSRDAARAQDAATRALELVPGGSFRGLANAQAVEAAGVVLLSVPFASHAATVKELAERLVEGQVVVDATVPLAASVGGRPTRMMQIWQGSAAQQARELLPDHVALVAALHTVSAASLSSLDQELDEDVLLCGDNAGTKDRVADLLGAIPGLRPVDAGRLEQARIVESLTAMLIGFNVRYRTHAGIRITGLPSAMPVRRA